MNESLADVAARLAVDAEAELRAADGEAALGNVKARYLGKDGSISALMRLLPTLPPDERRAAGSAVNAAKGSVEALAQQLRQALLDRALSRGADAPIDPTLPGRRAFRGHLHPVTRAWDEITDIFTSMGYAIEEGPQVEDDWHNFEALALPPGHPARAMQDTFYVEGGFLLRTHTSPVQVRTMQRQKPPIRMICPGPVYRRDNDATHTPMFHQVEGLVVDERTTMAELKGTLAEFARAFFGREASVRFRPSYFPFTEPSVEVDISCVFCKQKGCRLCKGTGWIEVLGAGMVDPAVFAAQDPVAYDPERVQGFAFGMGIDRLAMLKYGIEDLRLLFENDLRLMEPF